MIRNQKGRRNLSTYVMVELGLKLEDFLKQKGLENNVTRAHSFDNLSENERLPLQNSAKVTDHIRERRLKIIKLTHVKKSPTLQIPLTIP